MEISIDYGSDDGDYSAFTFLEKGEIKNHICLRNSELRLLMNVLKSAPDTVTGEQQTLSGSTRADAHSAKIGRLLERSCEMYGKGAIIHEHLVSDILKCARQLQIA